MLKLIYLLSPVYISIFWALVLLISKKDRFVSKSFLGVFFTVVTVLFSCHMIYYMEFKLIYIHIDAIYYCTHLLVYPLYYIYIRMLTIDNKFSFSQHFKYLIIPIVLSALYFFGTIGMSHGEHMEFAYSKSWPMLSYQGIVLILIKSAFIIQGVVYMIFAIKHIRNNRKKVEQYYSNTGKTSMWATEHIILVLMIAIIAGVIFEVIGKSNFYVNEVLLSIPSILFTISLFAIGMAGENQAPVIMSDNVMDNNNVPLQENEDENYILRESIVFLFEEKKVYLNKDLTINDVARMALSNRSYVSHLINNTWNTNFSNFVNKYRVEHVKTILRTNPFISSTELSEMSGFGSTDSLYRCFSYFEKISLRKYRSNL